jgi:hypothetical protein
MEKSLERIELCVTLHINKNLSVSPNSTGYPKKTTVDKHIIIPRIIILLNNGADFLIYLKIKL